MSKLMSLDVGEKRIGLAATDELLITCAPYGYIEREGAIEKLKQTFTGENITKIVVGMPFLPSGGLGSQAEDVNKFVEELRHEINIEIDFENEVLSSVEAERRLHEMKLKDMEKGDVDAMAACIILESYLRKETNK